MSKERPGGLQRRTLIQAAALGAAFPAIARAQGAPVRVGYAIARTGPWTTGAQVSQEPNYLLWAEQQNAAGGLMVKGQRRMIELIGSDDRSDIETCVRSYEKLMSSDKVDLIPAPWGSNANFAVAPLADRLGYPLLGPTALSRRLIEMKLPYFFSMLQQPAPSRKVLRTKSGPTLAEFERRIAEHDEVMECYLMSGDSDYLIRVAISDIPALEKFIVEQLTPIPGIDKIRSSFALKQVRYKTALPLPAIGRSR